MDLVRVTKGDYHCNPMAGSQLAAPKELRAKWYLQTDKYKQPVGYVCSIFGISRKTYYKWYAKDHPFGMSGKRKRKEHPQTKIIGAVRLELISAKRKYNYGPAKMRLHLQQSLGVSVAAGNIYKFYKKHNLIRKPQKKLTWYTPLRKPYVATYPGENVQLDVKYVPAPDGCWLYQYRFMDTVTNMQFATTKLNRNAKNTIAALHAAMRYFPFPITGIQTDNGGEFRGVFHDYLVAQHIPHRFIPKRSAPWNGKVERANRSVDDEYYLNYGRPWKTIFAYTNWYNHERPHLGKEMNGLTPYNKYLSLKHTIQAQKV